MECHCGRKLSKTFYQFNAVRFCSVDCLREFLNKDKSKCGYCDKARAKKGRPQTRPFNQTDPTSSATVKSSPLIKSGGQTHAILCSVDCWSKYHLCQNCGQRVFKPELGKRFSVLVQGRHVSLICCSDSCFLSFKNAKESHMSLKSMSSSSEMDGIGPGSNQADLETKDVQCCHICNETSSLQFILTVNEEVVGIEPGSYGFCSDVCLTQMETCHSLTLINCKSCGPFLERTSHIPCLPTLCDAEQIYTFCSKYCLALCGPMLLSNVTSCSVCKTRGPNHRTIFQCTDGENVPFCSEHCISKTGRIDTCSFCSKIRKVGIFYRDLLFCSATCKLSFTAQAVGTKVAVASNEVGGRYIVRTVTGYIIRKAAGIWILRNAPGERCSQCSRLAGLQSRFLKLFDVPLYCCSILCVTKAQFAGVGQPLTNPPIGTCDNCGVCGVAQSFSIILNSGNQLRYCSRKCFHSIERLSQAQRTSVVTVPAQKLTLPYSEMTTSTVNTKSTTCLPSELSSQAPTVSPGNKNLRRCKWCEKMCSPQGDDMVAGYCSQRCLQLASCTPLESETISCRFCQRYIFRDNKVTMKFSGGKTFDYCSRKCMQTAIEKSAPGSKVMIVKKKKTKQEPVELTLDDTDRPSSSVPPQVELDIKHSPVASPDLDMKHSPVVSPDLIEIPNDVGPMLKSNLARETSEFDVKTNAMPVLTLDSTQPVIHKTPIFQDHFNNRLLQLSSQRIADDERRLSLDSHRTPITTKTPTILPKVRNVIQLPMAEASTNLGFKITPGPSLQTATTQTVCSSKQEKGVQTDFPMFIPIPLPILCPIPIPVPFQQPVPMPLAFPLPAPAIIPIPMSDKTMERFKKNVENMIDEMPSNHYELDVIKIAQAVADTDEIARVLEQSKTDQLVDAGETDSRESSSPNLLVNQKLWRHKDEPQTSKESVDKLNPSSPFLSQSTKFKPSLKSTSRKSQKRSAAQIEMRAKRQRTEPSAKIVPRTKRKSALKANEVMKSWVGTSKDVADSDDEIDDDNEEDEISSDVGEYVDDDDGDVNTFSDHSLSTNDPQETVDDNNISNPNLFWTDWINKQDRDEWNADLVEMKSKTLNEVLHHLVTNGIDSDGKSFSNSFLFSILLEIQQHLTKAGREDLIFYDSLYSSTIKAYDERIEQIDSADDQSFVHERTLWSCDHFGCDKPWQLLTTVLFAVLKAYPECTPKDVAKLTFDSVRKGPKVNKTNVHKWHFSLPGKNANTISQSSLSKAIEFYHSKSPQLNQWSEEDWIPFILSPEENSTSDSPLWYKRTLLDVQIIGQMIRRLKLIL